MNIKTEFEDSGEGMTTMKKALPLKGKTYGAQDISSMIKTMSSI